MTYQQLLRERIAYALRLNEAIETEAISFLMMELAGLTSTEFYLKFGQEAPQDFINIFYQAVDDYVIHHIPVQHIIGTSYFYGRKMMVSSDVLIPRRETEELVEHILIQYDTYFSNRPIRILDMATGSGCIGITLKLETMQTDVTVSDISQAALDVAKKNAQLLGADITCIQSDWFKNIKGTFDIISANPPYVPKDEVVSKLVEKEPSLALYGGDDGLKFYEEILKQVKPYLNDHALLAFEHGYQHQDALRKMIMHYLPEASIKQCRDMQQKDRITLVGLGDVKL